jgi:hypothetical protein
LGRHLNTDVQGTEDLGEEATMTFSQSEHEGSEVESHDTSYDSPVTSARDGIIAAGSKESLSVDKDSKRSGMKKSIPSLMSVSMPSVSIPSMGSMPSKVVPKSYVPHLPYHPD